MNADIALAIVYLAFIAVCTYLTLFWVLPGFWRWLLFPEDWSEPEPLPPEGSVAYQMLLIQREVHVAQRAVGEAILPVLQRLADDLNKVLRRRGKGP